MVEKTNIFFGDYRVVIMDNGKPLLFSESETAPFPDDRGTHPNNWHQLVTDKPMHAYEGCPYCYVHHHPEEIRQITLSLPRQEIMDNGTLLDVSSEPRGYHKPEIFD